MVINNNDIVDKILAIFLSEVPNTRRCFKSILGSFFCHIKNYFNIAY